MKTTTLLALSMLLLTGCTAREAPSALPEETAGLFADREAARPTLEAMYTETGFSWSHFRYVGVELPSFDLRDRLAEITTRSLVIAGAHDMSPPSKVEVLHRGLPDSRFVVFDDSGHFAPIEETEKFVATVLEFLGIAE